MGNSLQLAEGWRVRRDDSQLNTAIRPTIRFFVEQRDPDDGEDAEWHEVTCPSISYSRRHEEWVMHPGSTTSQIEPDEAIARARAFVVAAEECRRRNTSP